MGKQSSAWITMQKKKRWQLMILVLFTLSTAMLFFIRSTANSCNTSSITTKTTTTATHFNSDEEKASNPLNFMKSKLVLLVSHELSLSGNISTSEFLFVSWENYLRLIKLSIQVGHCCWWSWHFCWEGSELKLCGLLTRNRTNVMKLFTV